MTFKPIRNQTNMQLSKLEIKGFKSFGDKITIHFDKGVTGIVGPNGCGKSNVVDAIRWVLGEQKTRNLRSEKMENLIFNGTKTRKPLQMAEVSLTFLNTKNILPTEYTTVTIGRRYYRDGESEYLLNGVTCRLKDITSLFLDTGIGPDSYAIIELKMVDDILSDRENSRRTLLEEAAGISKFKIRKKETFRKLEDTQADLDRLEDVLFEIRKNMKVLEKQARQAEEYFTIKENYKNASIELAYNQSITKFIEVESIQKGQRELQQNLEQIRIDIASKEAELEKIKWTILQEEKTLSSRQKTLNQLSAQISEMENEQKLKAERIKFYVQRLEKLHKEEPYLNQQSHEIEQKINRLEHEKLTLNQELLGLSKERDEAEQAYKLAKEQAAEKKDLSDTLQSELRLHQQELYAFKKSQELAETQLKDFENELKKAVIATEDQTLFLENFEKKIDTLRKEREAKEAERKKLEDHEINLVATIEQKHKEGEVLREDLAQLNRQFDSKQNELMLTRALVENLEGFPEAVKFLRRNKSWSKKAPLLADIINVEDKYKIALETVLEPFLNYYVVQNEQEAYMALKLLSDNQKGKCNFFILDALKDAAPKPEAERIEDAIPAIDLVEYEAQYHNLIVHLLHNVYITHRPIPFSGTSSADTLVIFGDMQWNWADKTVVSVSGSMTKRKYSISGGSTSIFEGNKIGKGLQIKRLEQEISELTLEIHNKKTWFEQNQEQIAALRLSTQKSLIEHLTKNLHVIEQELAAISARKEQSLDLLQNSKSQKDAIINRIAQIQESINHLLPKVEQQTFHVEQLENQIQLLTVEGKERAQQTEEKEKRFNYLNISLLQKQNSLNSIEKELDIRKQELENIRNQIIRFEAEKIQNQQELSNLESENTSETNKLPEMYDEKKNIEAGLSEAEQQYFQSRSTIEKLEKEIKEYQRKKESRQEEIAAFQQKISEINHQILAIKERIKIEFEADLDNPEEELIQPEQEEEQKLLEKVRKYKNQFERLGPINLVAREAYKEIKERCDFIEEQKKDLLEARTALQNTITEIEEVAKSHFAETFEKVKENFKHVFRSLFTEEDTCDLVLLDPANPLDSDIDIVARPKGKKPLSINQLSGGEKTLTAISLLFSIYLIKPAPFCIFDEADAPLDDSNIDKFNKIIRKFSNESQFILVTHNKRTMASTDVIYGVTMPEQGVSRVLPVDLRELA